MSRLFLIISICVLVLLTSCSPKKSSVVKTSKKGDVVLILNDIPENYRLYRNKDRTGGYSVTGGNQEIQCNVNDIVPFLFRPDYSRDKDTILFKSVSGLLEIQHKYKALDVLCFLARPKDTLFFNYKDKMPIVHSSSMSKKHDFDYESIVRHLVYNDEFSAFTMYNIPYFIRHAYKDLKSPTFEGRQKEMKRSDSLNHAINYPKAMLQFDHEAKTLDSLLLNDYISKDFATYYRERIKYKRMLLNLKHKQMLSFKIFTQDDNLLKYSFYRSVIYTIAYSEIISKAKTKTSSNGSDFDPEEIYDMIQNNPYLSDGTRKLLSYNCIKNIISLSSNKKIQEYFNLFRTTYAKDSELIDGLVKEYNLDAVVSDDISLLSEDGVKTSFKDLLAKNKGKLIYVDFWASWCAPCKRGMPDSHKLKEEFKAKDVTFIYLAYKDRMKDWKRVIGDLGLEGDDNSFIIEDSKTSRLIEYYKISTVPRYMIFGKDGSLLYKNAPRPASKDIRKIFNDLLNRK